MNGFGTKVLICVVVIAGIITYLVWPRHLPSPEEKNRSWSLGGMSMVTPPDWEGIPLRGDKTFDDGLMLRPQLDGKRQASITVRRYRTSPKMEDLTTRRDKTANDTIFNGYHGYYIEGHTSKDYLYRYVFEVKGKWHVVILSSPLPVEMEGSDWQQYLKTFRAADGSATTEPSTAPTTNPG